MGTTMVNESKTEFMVMDRQEEQKQKAHRAINIW